VNPVVELFVVYLGAGQWNEEITEPGADHGTLNRREVPLGGARVPGGPWPLLFSTL
jgi:hypothetical protein